MNTNPIYTLRAAMRLMNLLLFVRHLLMFTALLLRRLAAAMARWWRDTYPASASSDASGCCCQPMAGFVMIHYSVYIRQGASYEGRTVHVKRMKAP